MKGVEPEGQKGEGMKSTVEPVRRCAKGWGPLRRRSPKPSSPSGPNGDEAEGEAVEGRVGERRAMNWAHVQSCVRNVESRCNPPHIVGLVTLLVYPWNISRCWQLGGIMGFLGRRVGEPSAINIPIIVPDGTLNTESLVCTLIFVMLLWL